MTLRTLTAVLFAFIILFLGSSSVFSVHESESALVLRLGGLRLDGYTRAPSVYQPGWHSKIPLLDRVLAFDMRSQHYRTPEHKPLVLATKEQAYLVLTYAAKWQITDPVLYYTHLNGNAKLAIDHVLEPQLNDIIRSEFSLRTSEQVISEDRANLLAAILRQAELVGKAQGIRISDVQILTINLPDEMLASVYKRMAAEHSQSAEEKRAEGNEQAVQIRAISDQKAASIKAEALSEAAKLRAEGDAEAAGLYAKAYAKDPQFYAYYRRLGMYVSSFQDSKDWLILKPMGGLLHDIQAGATPDNLEHK